MIIRKMHLLYLTQISYVDVFLAFYINSAPMNSIGYVCMHPLVYCSCCTILDIRMYAAAVTVTHWLPHKDIIESRLTVVSRAAK